MTRRKHRPRRDEALITAREILAGTVCECGHVAGDHHGVSGFGAAVDEPPNPCGNTNDDHGCPCEQFSAVVFRVERL